MRKKIRLEQFTCPSCTNKIEKAVGNLKGVNSLEVGFNTSTVVVEFDENIISLKNIERVIKDLGFVIK
ncbi:MAG: heavy-metal-associated domain-containing protein [Erysipelotrichaceae bacterium]|nr:heavy-metal-associated domain-containing protein [Erysipelotrichaceae bacterium]